MTEPAFDQANIVHSMCLALATINRAGAEISARILADIVMPTYPTVPLSALRVIAAKALRLYFDPVNVDDIMEGVFELQDRIEANDFFGAAIVAEINALRNERATVHDGSNVVVSMRQAGEPAMPRNGA